MMFTPETSPTLYGAIDLKSFYASVECVERGLNPLTTNLVVADPTRTEKTICLAVSPSLKAYGIPGRARLFEVEQRLQEIQRNTGKTISYLQAPPRMALYTAYSAKIFSIYLRYLSPDDIHPYSIDEIFFSIQPYLSLYHMTAHQLVTAMIREVLYETGITATGGIGTNLYLAKVAMDIMAKHSPADADGVRIAELDEMRYREQLWNQEPITDFWMFGAAKQRELNQLGIYTMGDLASYSIHSRDILYRKFKQYAEVMIDHAWGVEPVTISHIKQYKPKSSSISSGQVLAEPYPNETAKLIVKEMCDQIALQLLEKKLVTSQLTLTVGFDRCNVDCGTYQGETHLDRYGRTVPKHAHGTVNLDSYTASTRKITTAVVKLFDQIVDPSLYVRRITIACCHVCEESSNGEQLSLFDLTGIEALEKEKKRQQTILNLRKRFGKNVVVRGMDLQKGATTIERNTQIGGHKA